MAVRKIIRIDEEKCDGCGQCVPACVEGALQVIDGKARLVSETYCDGLGACLGTCPKGAIIIEEREAGEFDEIAAKRNLIRKVAALQPAHGNVSHGCPGSVMRTLTAPTIEVPEASAAQPSQLSHWPVQLMLVPPHALFLKNSDLLICADCVPFAVADFHTRYLKGRAVLVGCPKLDNLEFYFERLKAIVETARPRRLTVLRMEVPCCGGIAEAALFARQQVDRTIPAEVHTVMIDGQIRTEEA